MELYQKYEEERKIKEAKMKEEKKKIFEIERLRTDIKILDNIEKLDEKNIELYKPVNKNLKFSFDKIPFMTGKNNDTIIKIKSIDNIDNYYIKKIDENKYGIMYYSDDFDTRFLDVYDCLNQNFYIE